MSESEEEEPEEEVENKSSHQAPQPINSFCKLLRTFDSLKVALASLEVFRNLDYFANYMWRKCKDNKMGKFKVIKVGGAHLIHMLDDGPNHNFPNASNPQTNDVSMGQLLFLKLQQGQNQQAHDKTDTNHEQFSDDNEDTYLS